MISRVVAKKNYSILVLKSGHRVKVDSEDVERLSSYSWHVNHYGYVVAGVWNSSKRQNDFIYMHKFLLGVPKFSKIQVDHRHGTLDNRKRSLRRATKQQNGQHRVKLNRNNRSGKVGVYFNSADGRWVATIKINYRRFVIGSYYKKDDAIVARTAAERELFGDFAPKV